MRFLQAYNRYKKIFKEIRVLLLTFAPRGFGRKTGAAGLSAGALEEKS